ncbi:hypothetical protein U1Q18_003585 [Sarracenia purpurea var. burkii]
MDEEMSWVSHCISDITRDFRRFNTFLELSDEADQGVMEVSLDLILPDDLLERILAHLPIASIFRAGCVCKKWHDMVSSRSFLWNFSRVSPHKPWYFMFTCSDEPIGYAYDPILRKWYNIKLPCIETSSWFITSSFGLVCFMDNDRRSELYVCNPITKRCRKLEEPPGFRSPDYSALAVSVNRTSHDYNVSVVKSKQVPGDFFRWDFSIHTYNSKTTAWTTILTDVLTGWRSGDESVICDGVLHFLIYSTGGGIRGSRHGLIAYNLLSRSSSSHDLLTKCSIIRVPFSLTCGRLMNLKEKLVMVGGIGKQNRHDIIKGIGIWILDGKEWQEIARMPRKLFLGFGEFDDVFASSGSDDLIYIQCYGSPALLVFSMNQKQWKWSHKCPVTKRFPLQLFTGFCFEPRLEIAP